VVRKKKRLGPNLLSDEMLGYVKSTKVPQRNGRNITEHSKKSLMFGMYELLRYEDRNSMAFSIESRVPFLDHKLVEVGLGLSSDDLIKDGWTKWPIRQMLDGKLDDSLVWRKEKKGFLTPQQSWKDQLLPFMLREVDRSRQDVFDNGLLESWIKKENLTNSQLSELWRVFSIIRWMDLFKVELI
jgi:asparagine synthase (glutamine-hydrolysing)